MQKWCSLTVAGAVGLLVACGGGDSVLPPPEEQPPEAAPALDFSAIADDWEGEWVVTETLTGRLEVSLNASARQNQVVGTADWLDDSGELDSRVDLRAVSAEPPMYTVEERIVEGSGEEGLISFDHDPVAETLSFRWEAFESGTTATGTLTRQN